MSCPHYLFKDDGWFGGNYYCLVIDRPVNNDTYYSFCRGYEYDSCPNYKAVHSNGGGCYITTACVHAKGLSDNCYELQILRMYRDTWLINQKEGKALIGEYYRIAPIII